MNTDIRIKTTFRLHRKLASLDKLLGKNSGLHVIYLWIRAAESRPDGFLYGISRDDIAYDAGWDGDPDLFVDALIKCRFLDVAEDGEMSLHDWAEHQPWACQAPERAEKARVNAAKRWAKRSGDNGDTKASTSDATSIAQPNSPDASSIAQVDDAGCSSPILSSPFLKDKILSAFSGNAVDAEKPTEEPAKQEPEPPDDHPVEPPCRTPDNAASNCNLENAVYAENGIPIDQPPSEKPPEGPVLITRKKRKLKGDRLAAFETFWTAFNYKRGRAEAADAWLDIVGYSQEVFRAIIAGATAEAKRRPDLITQNRTPKMAQGWLSGRRWEDEDLTSGGATERKWYEDDD